MKALGNRFHAPDVAGLKAALGNGNFWLAASVAFTNLAAVLPKPYSVIFYVITAQCALIGAFLKSTSYGGEDHVDH